jgi:hypothetical protein
MPKNPILLSLIDKFINVLSKYNSHNLAWIYSITVRENNLDEIITFDNCIKETKVKKNLKLFLCLIKHYAVKKYGGVDV